MMRNQFRGYAKKKKEQQKKNLTKTKQKTLPKEINFRNHVASLIVSYDWFHLPTSAKKNTRKPGSFRQVGEGSFTDVTRKGWMKDVVDEG